MRNLLTVYFLSLLICVFSINITLASTLELTEQEKNWIRQNPVINFTGDPNWLPYEAFDSSGTYYGIVAEHLQEIKQQSQLSFNAIPVKDWTESLKIAIEGKVDVISGDAADVILNQNFIPIDTYSVNPIVIIMDINQNYVDNLDEIKEKRIAIIKDYGYTADVFKTYPNISFIKVDNIQQGLNAVSTGKVDAMLATMALASYNIAEMGIYNIKIVGKTPIVMELTLFVSKNKPVLYSILNKSMLSVADENKHQIVQKWIKHKYVEKIDYNVIIQLALVFSSIIALILFRFYWLQKKVSKQLEEKTSRLLFQQTAFDEHAIVSMTDVKGNITYANEKFLQISKYSHDELIGQNHRILKTSFHSDAFFTDMWKTIANGNVWHGEIKNKAKDGSFYWVASTIIPFLNAQRKPEQYFSIRTDITKQKLIEIELEKSRSRFDISQSFANIGTWEWDVVTNDLYWSDQLYKLLGYEQGQVEGNFDDFLKVMHPDDIDITMAAINKSIETGCHYHIEHRVVTSDTKIQWFSEEGDVIRDNKGKVIRMLGITQDITLRKQHEEKLAKASKAKSEFLSSMSHELRTPLNAILGFAQLLEMADEDNPLSEDQKSSVNFILSSGQHLLSLINDVLELSAIEAGKTDLSIESIQLIDVITDSLSLIAPIATKANIHIHVTSDLPLRVNADKTKLKQILINLISNAIKYNRKNGNVKIDWKLVNNGMVRVGIADTGIGISEDNQKKVFNAFNRLGQENSSIEGSGIGLLVTKELVEMMSGEIGFHSIEQQGSTFWFELPLTEVSENEQVELKVMKTEESIENINGLSDIKSILYVEDNPANRQLMQSFFKRQKNYRLTLVETGELGWEVALEQDFDLILMDIHLPGIDGKALTEKLRETSQYKNKPIVAMTAAAMTHDIQAADGLFDDYLTKPIEIPKLLNTLKKYLS